jgi:FKBP-type peptidyl-prolyl cis-trans isomerase
MRTSTPELRSTICTLLCFLAATLGCERHDSWKTDSGLEVTEIREGEGGIPAAGDVVSIRYTGWYLDGKRVDSTDRLGAPLEFRMGKGQLLRGMEEGVATMRKGGKRILVLPPKLAYGEEGRPGVVPPNAWIKFEVELVDIRPGPPAILPWNDSGMEIIATKTGLQFVDFQLGQGKFPELGSTVVVQYTGFLDDGTLFDSTYHQGYPVEFELSAKRLIPGWVEGLLSMQAGGRRKLIIPPFLGYGDKGYGTVIPPNATLIYDIELLEIK